MLPKRFLHYEVEETISSSSMSRAADNLIVSLRKKIEADPHAPRHILTAHGVGYKLVE